MKTTRYDGSVHLKTRADRLDAMRDALSSGSPAVAAAAAKDVARSLGNVTETARRLGLTRAALYRREPDVRLSTLLKILGDAGLELTARRKK